MYLINIILFWAPTLKQNYSSCLCSLCNRAAFHLFIFAWKHFQISQAIIHRCLLWCCCMARITFELWNYSSIRPATIKDGSRRRKQGWIRYCGSARFEAAARHIHTQQQCIYPRNFAIRLSCLQQIYRERNLCICRRRRRWRRCALLL